MSKKKQSNKDEARKIAGLKWSNEAWDDYCHWLKADPQIHESIDRLINECRRTPFKGTGKPEALKGDYLASGPAALPKYTA